MRSCRFGFPESPPEAPRFASLCHLTAHILRGVQSGSSLRSAAALPKPISLRETVVSLLEDLADKVGAISAGYPNADQTSAPKLQPEAGTVYLFADGLRADLAKELVELLENAGQECTGEFAWSALPSVTATAKPAWSPLTEKIEGKAVGIGFEPQFASTGKDLSTATFRETIGEVGLSYLPPNEVGDLGGCAWTEVADFDSRGHKEGRN